MPAPDRELALHKLRGVALKEEQEWMRKRHGFTQKDEYYRWEIQFNGRRFEVAFYELISASQRGEFDGPKPLRLSDYQLADIFGCSNPDALDGTIFEFDPSDLYRGLTVKPPRPLPQSGDTLVAAVEAWAESPLQKFVRQYRSRGH